MHYQVSRNGQTYGPYTFEDLQRYLASGNVLPTDLAKSEEMADWVPVSQILSGQGAGTGYADGGATGFGAGASGTGASGVGAGGVGAGGAAFAGAAGGAFGSQPYGEPAYGGGLPGGSNAALAASQYPDAPNLSWGLVLLFAILTCGLFMIIWNIIVCAWLRKVQPNSNAMFIYIGVVVLAIIQVTVSVPYSLHHAMSPGIHTSYNPIGGLLGLIVWVARLVARFSERASLEEHFNGPEPVGLSLNPVMTFFFGGLYIQSQLTRINQMKQAARSGLARAY